METNSYPLQRGLKYTSRYRDDDLPLTSLQASNLRRLASDHASLHNSGLPPHYLFPPSTSLSAIPDDLTQLTILLTGPQGTPYSQGLWRLHLKIPNDYPKNPPKASFRTRIWHPNVDETSGAVCVDTLKRDWEPKLTLRDVLIVSLVGSSAFRATLSHYAQVFLTSYLT